MFGDTFVVPHADGNITCVKINQDGYSSEYLKKGTLDETRVRIRHTKTNSTAAQVSKDRHNVEILQTVYATATEAEFQRKVYVVVELVPDDPDTKLTDALADWLIVVGNIAKLVGWES